MRTETPPLALGVCSTSNGVTTAGWQLALAASGMGPLDRAFAFFSADASSCRIAAFIPDKLMPPTVLMPALSQRTANPRLAYSVKFDGSLPRLMIFRRACRSGGAHGRAATVFATSRQHTR